MPEYLTRKKLPGKGENMAKNSKTRLAGRDASTGKFVSVEDARKRPNTTVVERLPIAKKGK